MGYTNLYRAGRAHLEELMLVAESEPVTPEDLAAILTQIDLLQRQASLLRTSQGFPDCRILAQLCNDDGIRAMVNAGTNPRIVRAVRKRRAKTYTACLNRLQAECFRRVGRALGSACHSGEWVLCLLQCGRCLRVRYNMLILRWAKRAYLMGFSVDVKPALERLKLLFEGS